MNNHDQIAVTSRSFSKNIELRKILSDQYKHIKFNDEGLKLENESLVDFLKDANKAIVGLEKFNCHILLKLPKLKVISRFGAGVDNVDQEALKQYNVQLSYVPGINRLAVAELTVSLMLQLIRNSFNASYELRQGKWIKIIGRQLTGKTIGIVGANHVGREVIRLLTSFQCKILIYDIVDLSAYCNQYACRQVSLDDLISQSDIISLHVPANKNTTNMIGAAVIQKMKKTAFLINTSRGIVIDQEALKMALKTQKIAGAALDVFQNEPEQDQELLSLPNLICTPHFAGNTVESELEMGRVAIVGLEKCRDEVYCIS